METFRLYTYNADGKRKEFPAVYIASTFTQMEKVADVAAAALNAHELYVGVYVEQIPLVDLTRGD